MSLFVAMLRVYHPNWSHSALTPLSFSVCDGANASTGDTASVTQHHKQKMNTLCSSETLLATLEHSNRWGLFPHVMQMMPVTPQAFAGAQARHWGSLPLNPRRAS